MKPHIPVAGDHRITVPIPAAILATNTGYPLASPYRRVLHPGYEVAVLDEREQSRLSNSPYRINADWRLEIFNKIDPSQFDPRSGRGHDRVDSLVTSTLGKLSLCLRGEFSGEFVIVDVYDGRYWKRLTHVDTSDRIHQGIHVWIPEARLDTWGGLIGNWPANPDDALTLALGYYRESVAHRRSGRLASAAVSAAIATEILFGDVNSELTYRISMRAAQLIGGGEDALRVQSAVKKLYGIRSKIVHTGKVADVEYVDVWHQLLMRAIPTVAAWGGSINGLRSELDKSTFIRSVDLDRLQAEGEWWSFCDFIECLNDSSLG